MAMPTSLFIDVSDPRYLTTRELWPGQHEHQRQYDAMLVEHAASGVYRDPVTGCVFPPGNAMLRDPNRVQRRRLAAWRAKVTKGSRK